MYKAEVDVERTLSRYGEILDETLIYRVTPLNVTRKGRIGGPVVVVLCVDYF